MAKPFIMIAGFIGLLAVGLGAFGAHGLKVVLTPGGLAVYQTGVQYQSIHALALLMTGILCQLVPNCRQFRWAGVAFIVGVLFFSGSLYILALSGLKWLGAIAPIGGAAFMVGWFFLIVGAYKAL